MSEKYDRRSSGNRGVDKDSDDERTLICGRNAVTEALKSGTLIDLVFVNKNAGGSISRICAMAAERGIPVKQVDDKKLDHMCAGAAHQGAAAMLGCAEYYSVQDILDFAKEKGEDPFIIICDEIEDPHNLGAIIRTANVCGAHGVIIPKNRAASLTAGAVRASAGAVSHTLVARVTNLTRTIDQLKEKGLWIICADMDGEPMYDVNLEGPVCLVTGNEGSGVSRLVKEHCDLKASIPMYGQISSLNASVACAVLAYEIVRRRIKRS